MQYEDYKPAPVAFSSSDLKRFLERLGIPVNGGTLSLALAIDFAMRRGERTSAEAAAQRLIKLFRTTPAPEGDTVLRREYNSNALDPAAPDAKLIEGTLAYYDSMQTTLQAADPEESLGEIYSDDMMTRIMRTTGLPDDPLIKPFLRMIGEAYATGGAHAAREQAQVLMLYLVVDGYVEEADRDGILDRVMNFVGAVETVTDQFGDPDGNEDFYEELQEGDDTAPEDGEFDTSLKVENDRLREEEDRRREAEALRARELNDRVVAETHLRELQLFADLSLREGGYLQQSGLNLDNEEDAALAEQIRIEMRQIVILPSNLTREGMEQVQASRAKIEELAARLAARTAAETDDVAELASEIARQIVQEATGIAKDIERQIPGIMKAVEEELRAEADAATAPAAPQDRPDPMLNEAREENPDPSETTDPDVQKVAIALKEKGLREAQQVAAQIARLAQKDGPLPVSPRDFVEDLLVRAQAFNTAMDEYNRKEMAAHRQAQNERKAATEARAKAEETDVEAQPRNDGAEGRAPSLSDYRDEMLEISFLQAEGSPEEARAAADRLAERLRGFGGDLARIDGAMILRYVERQDKKASDARAAEASAKTDEDDDDDDSDRASWFLSMALRKDDRSVQIYDGLVRALIRGDKKAAGTLAKALANHILKIFRINVTLVEMLTAIVNAARQDAKAKQEETKETPLDHGHDGDHDDEGDGADGAAGAVTAETEKGTDDSQTKYDMGTVKKVDWPAILSVYNMDPEESEAVADVARLIVRKGMESSGVLKSAKDLLTRSRKKVKGAKVKNHLHLAAAIEDAMIKKTESKKVLKPLKFADIPEDMSDDLSV